MAKSPNRKPAKAARFDIDAAIVDAIELAVKKTSKATIIEKLRQGAEGDDDFRRWLVLLFDPDLVTQFSGDSSADSNSPSTKPHSSGKSPSKTHRASKTTKQTARSISKTSAKPSLKFEVLVESTRQAMEKATEVDQSRINYNFSYDYQAYEEVHRNLKKLIELERLDLAMQLAIELMRKGSHQMEMSDEGLMVDEIEECLNPVIEAVKASALSAGEKLQWCQAMTNADQIGCVCELGIRRLKTACKE